MSERATHITVTVTTIDGKANDHRYDLPEDLDGINEVVLSVSKAVVDPFTQKRALLALGNPNSVYNLKHVVSVMINSGIAESDEPIHAEVKRQIGLVQDRPR